MPTASADDEGMAIAAGSAGDEAFPGNSWWTP